MRHTWEHPTQSDYAAAARLYQAGRTLAQIGDALDVSPRTIARWLNQVPDLQRVGSGRRPRTKPFPHGTNTGYNYGCRLECCRKVHADYHREYRKRRKAKGGNAGPHG